MHALYLLLLAWRTPYLLGYSADYSSSVAIKALHGPVVSWFLRYLLYWRSRTRAGLIENAKLLLSMNSVRRGPVTTNGFPSFSVTSKSGKRPNYVVLENSGKVECECPHWKVTKICSHALAVAAKEDELPYVS